MIGGEVSIKLDLIKLTCRGHKAISGLLDWHASSVSSGIFSGIKDDMAPRSKVRHNCSFKALLSLFRFFFLDLLFEP